MKEATMRPDGLAVMAFFFKISNPNPAYEELSELLDTIKKPHTSASFSEPLALQDFMLSNMHEYYVYNGSLTTPPCLEVVTWLDFYDPIEISHDQVSESARCHDSLIKFTPTNFYRKSTIFGTRFYFFSSSSSSCFFMACSRDRNKN